MSKDTKQTKIRPLSRTDFRLAPQVGLEPTTHGLTAGRYKPSIGCYLSIISNSIRIYGRATLYGLPCRPLIAPRPFHFASKFTIFFQIHRPF